MHMKIDNIPDRIKIELDVRNDLFGDQFVSDLRPVAGKSAAKSGRAFEDIVESILYGKSRIITKRPKFKCHFGLPREGDFEIVSAERQIHIECKQLGNIESHFDKLSHVMLNLVAGCYGEEMWLVYDYNASVNPRGYRNIEALVKRSDVLKKQVALQGITFELVLIDDLEEKMKEFV
jgi:hypothetical protein|tara:strand:- start:33 stop:563 length:531 start_codon:yes stop_codon:yes gene_type:complete